MKKITSVEAIKRKYYFSWSLSFTAGFLKEKCIAAEFKRSPDVTVKADVKRCNEEQLEKPQIKKTPKPHKHGNLLLLLLPKETELKGDGI